MLGRDTSALLVKRLLMARFAIPDLGKASLALGMKITQDRGAGWLKIGRADHVT